MNKIKIGDVYAIPLPNGKYAFGRVLKDCCIAIYKQLSSECDNIPQDESYQFVVGVYQDVLKSGTWKKIRNIPFADESDSEPPQFYMLDKISGKYRIYHMGNISSSSKEECEDLEEAAVWDENHITDRIISELVSET